MSLRDVVQTVLDRHVLALRARREVYPPKQRVSWPKSVTPGAVVVLRGKTDFTFLRLVRARRVMSDKMTHRLREARTGEVAGTIQGMEARHGMTVPNVMQRCGHDRLGAQSGWQYLGHDAALRPDANE
jgi:hypothetical protein